MQIELALFLEGRRDLGGMRRFNRLLTTLAHPADDTFLDAKSLGQWS
jgi:hypothetical protein